MLVHALILFFRASSSPEATPQGPAFSTSIPKSILLLVLLRSSSFLSLVDLVLLLDVLVLCFSVYCTPDVPYVLFISSGAFPFCSP